MWTHLRLYLLSTLLATGSTLFCEVCDSTEESCSGPLLTCAPWEESCVTSVMVITYGTNTVTYASKSCLESMNCKNTPFSFTFSNNITVRANTSCCDTDGCNVGAIPVPPVSLVPNGWQCPSCFVLGKDRCEDMEPLACTGVEDHCAYHMGTIRIGDLIVMRTQAGCASPALTKLRVGMNKYTQSMMDLIIQSETVPASMVRGGTKEP